MLRVANFPLPQSAALVLYTDAGSGNDSTNDGSKASPFASLARGLEAVRAHRAARGIDAARLTEADRAYLILREGTFFLGARSAGTLQFSAADSYVTLQAHPGEDVVISGGVALDGLSWGRRVDAIPKRELYEYRAGTLADGFDAAPPALMTIAEAQARCSSLPTCAAISFPDTVSPPSVKKVMASFKHEVFWVEGQTGTTYVRNIGYEPGAANLYRSAVTAGKLRAPITALRVHGRRAVRARYPNVKTVEQLGAMQIRAKAWTPQSSLNLTKTANYTFEPDAPRRNDTAQGFFQAFKIGVGGDCAMRFTPQAGYWCSDDSQGGGPGPYSAPVGMTVTNESTSLPHTPYGASAKLASQDGMLVHTWRAGRWFSWVMQTEGLPQYDPQSGTTTFDFSLEVGGNQGSRGGDAGQEFFVENVFDELDSPGEFFYDASPPGAASMPAIWLWHNATGPPPTSGLVAPQLVVIINASGTQAEPVVGVGFKGLTFRDSAPNYLGPHGTPSGGDWAVGRAGALWFEGTIGSLVEGCALAP